MSKTVVIGVGESQGVARLTKGGGGQLETVCVSDVCVSLLLPINATNIMLLLRLWLALSPLLAAFSEYSERSERR